MILLLHREHDEDSYSLMETFDNIDQVRERKSDNFSASMIKESGYRCFFVTPMTFNNKGIKSSFDDDRGTHLVYLDNTRTSEFTGEPLKAWRDYMISNILNKNSI